MTELTKEQALRQAKAQSRKVACKVRARAYEAAGGEVAAVLAATGLGFLGDCAKGVVSGFYPYRSELDLRPLLQRLSGEGWTTCLPIVIGQGKPLIFRAWAPGEATEPGAWDIPVPLKTATIVKPDVMLVPLLAFDSQGYRLGYGGGFYDRTIEKFQAEKRLTTVGVAFSAQQVDLVVHGAHDQPLDWILTENGPMRVAQIKKVAP